MGGYLGLVPGAAKVAESMMVSADTTIPCQCFHSKPLPSFRHSGHLYPHADRQSEELSAQIAERKAECRAQSGVPNHSTTL
jgi:hypothetical protein